MNIETLKPVTDLPQEETTLPQPEKKLTPEERRDMRLDEIIDRGGIIFEDTSQTKNEIKAVTNDFASEKVDEVLIQKNEEVESIIKKLNKAQAKLDRANENNLYVIEGRIDKEDDLRQKEQDEKKTF